MASRSTDTTLSQKEYARRMRRAAYLRAKELRAKDPKHLAMKAALKQRRREAYQRAKDHRKVTVRKEKERMAERQTEKRAATALELMKLLTSSADPAHSAHRDRAFRAIVIARSGHRDRSEATLAWSTLGCWVRLDGPFSTIRWAWWTRRSQTASARVGSAR